jgi:hypothetical protein
MPHDFSRGCTIPLAQSIAAGLLAGLIIAGIAFWMDWPRPWFLAGVACGCVSFWWFTGSINLWRAAEYQPLPTLSQPVQETVSQPIIINVEKQQTLLGDITASPVQLKELANGLLSGIPFSEDSWTPEYKLFSKPQFRSVRDEFIKLKLAKWVNPNAHAQGVALTHYGLEMCKKIVVG